MKKIGIVGAGVAGSYLANLLFEDCEIAVYDGYARRGCRCGWGSSLSLLKPKLEKIGLDLDDYVLCKPEFAFWNGIHFQVRNSVVFNKPQVLKDMTKDIEVVPNYVNFDQLPWCDVIVNATGKPLLSEQICYTVQWKMKLDEPEEKTAYVWFSPQLIGYAWVFPLSGKMFHVGGGSIYGTMDAVSIAKRMLDSYDLTIKKVICGCKKKLSFGRNLPVFQDNIVSVGEAVGCVHPLTGEGILPSIRSAELLAESLRDPSFPMNYVFKLEEITGQYREAFEALETLKHHRRLGMIKFIRTMTKRLKGRTQPEVNWWGKMQALMKFLV